MAENIENFQDDRHRHPEGGQAGAFAPPLDFQKYVLN